MTILAETPDEAPKRRRVPRRTPRACKQCRTAKIRCSGAQPCERCTRRGEECRFPSDEPLVAVPESYLRELEKRAVAAGNLPASNVQVRPNRTQDGQDRYPSPQTSNGGHNSNPSASAASPSIQNPLVGRNALSFIRDTSGRPRFLGHTSTWSFTRRVFALLQDHPSQVQSPPDPFHLDGTAYNFTWTPRTTIEPADVADLPPQAYADYLYNTFKFHFAETAGLVDDHLFTQGSKNLQQSPLEFAKANQLWFVQYLWVLAFGKAFLANGAAKSKNPPGHEYARRAMALMTGAHDLHHGSVIAIEVLTMASLYLQSIDMRVLAYQQIGQALRLCFVEGIHCEVPEVAASPDLEPARCRRVFDIVCRVDSRLSALTGAPTPVCFKEICTLPPPDEPTSSSTLVLPLLNRLSRLVSKMCTTVYAAGNSLETDFIENTSSVLHELAEVSRDMEDISSRQTTSNASTMAHDLSHTMLAYHHCIVLATRPLVMWLLMRSLSTSTTSPVEILSPIDSLLQISVQSATAILAMLNHLANHDLLETFLPWQLEYGFSASMLLAIISAILPSFVTDPSWQVNTQAVLDEMINRGNIVATMRKSELDHLDSSLLPLRSSSTIGPGEANAQSGDVVNDETDTHMDVTGLDMFLDGEFGGFNYDQILDLAAQFDPGEFALTRQIIP